ncbi:30S ribosomal protein S27ae [Candidatus Woesearchaeota archaeon]|nr:30S ribosomal protein S27ae [Candidatus Woesearchaeota archaeon]
MAQAKSKAPKGLWNNFSKSGDAVTRKNKSCPKCGSGYLMAKHKDRSYCGKCRYTEFSKG